MVINYGSLYLIFIIWIFMLKSECRPPGSEALPKGLVANTSDLQMHPLWGHRKVYMRFELTYGHHMTTVIIKLIYIFFHGVVISG